MANKLYNKGVSKEKAPELTADQKDFNKKLSRAVSMRAKSCFWNEGDWVDRWDLQNEYNLPKQDAPSDETGFRSRVKSPEVVARNQSTMQKLKKLNLGFRVRPLREQAKFAAKIDQEVLNYFFNTGDFRRSLDGAMQTSINNGSGILGVEWVKKGRKVKMPITNADEMDDEQKRAAKKGELPAVEVEVVDYRGPLLLNYELPSVYFDPNAISVQGHHRNADYAFVVEMMPMDVFKSEFGGKPGFENIDKVQPVTSAFVNEENIESSPDMFLKTPIDDEGEFVQVVKGWCYSKDWYMIRANGVFIKSTFIPYVDKMIPLEVIKPYSYPNQLYGIAPVDLLIPTIYQMELMLNTFFDYVIYTTNPVLVVDKYDYGDFSRKYELVNGQPGAILPLSNPTGGISPIKYPPLNIDIYQGIDRLQRDAVIATQHDPSQLGYMKKDVSATANIMNKEVLDNHIGFIVGNYKTSFDNVARMVISRIHQFMKRQDVDKIVNGKGEARPFEVPIVGKDVEIDWDERTISIEENPEKVSMVTISDKLYRYEDPETGELLEVTPEDYDIQVDTESMEVISKALEQQKIMEVFGQMVQYAVNPNNPEMAMQHPLGLINGVVLMQELIEKTGLNEKLLIVPAEDIEKSLQKAEQQNMQMFSGERAMGEPGEPQEHVQHHVRFQQHLMNLYQNIMDDLKNTVMAGMPIEVEKQQQFDQLKLAIRLISEHIDLDTTPVLAQAMRAKQEGAAMTQPPQQPQAPAPMGQSITKGGLGASQAAPNVPRAAGMTEGGPGEMPMM